MGEGVDRKLRIKVDSGRFFFVGVFGKGEK